MPALELNMIRFTRPEDIDALLALAAATGLFEPEQIAELAHMLEQHVQPATANAGIWLTDDAGQPVGVAYVAPERMTHGTWNLYLIAIHPDHQQHGRGTRLLAYIEHMLTERGHRLLLVETSGTDDFAYVRQFYRDRGYQEQGRIPNFYMDGVDKVIFAKSLPQSTLQSVGSAPALS